MQRLHQQLKIIIIIGLALVVFRTCSCQPLQFLGQLPFTSYVSRASPPGNTIYTFVAVSTTDSRPNGISYSLVEGSYDQNVFEIDAHTGHLVILRYLPLQKWVLLVQADKGSEKVTANLSVVVLPEYNVSPVFEQNNFIFNLSEYTSINSLFAVVRAFSLDPESGEHSYSIASGNTGNDLAINVTTGVLSVARELDYETTTYYHLVVQYSDTVHEVSVSVEVQVINENDNHPQFSEVLYEATLSEDQLEGASVLSVLASDRDSAANGMVRYSIVEGGAGFEINRVSGEVITTTSLDYEQESVHNFTVVACDSGVPTLSSTVIVVVTVSNVDDECPVFESEYYSVTLFPGSPSVEVGMVIQVMTVHAIDPDGLSEVTYSLVSDSHNGALHLDLNTGTISLTDASPNIYTLYIAARDATCEDQSIVEVVINIGGSINHTPRFNGQCKAEIMENSASGTIVTTLQATDGDDGVYGELTYAFTDETDESPLFSLDATTGDVTLSNDALLDREVQSFHVMGVTATDGGNKQAFCLLNITVLDINDNEPTFLTSSYEVKLSQNPSPGTYVVQVLAEDSDDGSNRVVQYELLNAFSDAFIINASSGVITTAMELTEEEYSSLTVRAVNTDALPILSSTASITVYIVDDIHLPAFTQPLYNTTICENLPYSTSILQVFPPANAGNIHYSLISGSQYYTNGPGGEGVFRIDLDGVISVTSQGVVDFEKLPDSKFIFSVRAENIAGQTLSISTIVISVLDSDDNGPTFRPSVVHASISENSPVGTLVTQLTPTDPDSGSNSEISYSLVFGEDDFKITDSGEITTLVEFDAENALKIQTLRISAYNPNPTDSNDPCPTVQQNGTVLVMVTILDINDNPPSFTDPPHTLTISESTPVGTTLHTFIAKDPDVTAANLGYTITNGNTEHKLRIDSTGNLILLELLNYEEEPSLALTVQLSDGTYCNTTHLTILVTDEDDEPPEFPGSTYSINVTENSALGTSILKVSATDVDTANITYWLTGPAEGRFAIDSSGVITIVGTIDREEFQDGVISFLVVAQGGVIATAAVTVTVIDVNDCVPRFQNKNVMSIPENVDPGTGGIHIGSMLAIDLDTGVNGQVSYMLLNGEEDGFTIDSSTGEITALLTYDREEVPFYTLLVKATDMGDSIQLSSTTSLQVNIGDENDNVPFFPFSYVFVWIFEGVDVGTEVIRMPAVDLDEGTNAKVTFTPLSEEPIQSVFTVNRTTGVVTLAGTLDYELPLQRLFTLTFTVADSIHEGDSEATLQIELLDQNDHTPELMVTATPLGVLIDETTPVGTVVFEVRASDEDSGTNAQITFSIISGDPYGDFVISAMDNDAVISIGQELDYENTTGYNLTIQACDRGTPPECAVLVQTFTVNNIDDVIPSFSQALYKGNVTENTNPVSSILQVMATDPDFGDRFEYKIESGNDGGRFSINSSTGVLSSTVPLDREEQETYILVITAADEGGTPLSGTGTAVITVLDVDDNPPANQSQWQINMLLLDGQLQEEQSIGFYFADPDAASTFSGCTPIETQHIEDFFSVNSANCLLLLKQGDLPVNSYGIRVNESDHGIYSQVDIEVEHLLLSDISTDYLVTISLAMSAARYLDSVYTSFPSDLAAILAIDSNQLIMVSIQDGYHDPINTVDVSFVVKTGDNSYLDPVYILQILYTQINSLRSLGYELSALPTDPCSAEPCVSQARCTSLRAVSYSSLTARSPSFVIISPTVELGYECECVPGTSGDNCSVNFDDCYSNPCQYNAQCIDEVDGFRCDCPSGTSGVDCSISPNGCSSSSCQNGAHCKDTPGSHSCLCLPGYYGSECQYHYFRTAPTCDSSPCRNGGTCSPGRDSFTCLCPDTYSGQLCELEATPQGCSSNTCYNGSTCTESPSGPVCSCSIGFTGPFCRWQIDNCELRPCHNGGTCATGLYGSYQCYCPPPYTGETCEDLVLGCDSDPCMHGGRCSDISGGDYACECTRGYSGDNCEYSVEPVNLCSDNPCLSGDCTYGLNSYTCSCPATHSGVHCENESPTSTPCDSNPCQHGGECTAGDTDYSCSCSPGFTGINCETNINDCTPNPCVYGACQDGINDYVCECSTSQITGYNCDVTCPNGLAGDFCDAVTMQCQVDEVQCQNGGSCLEGLGSYSCICPPTHTGPMCEHEITCDAVQCFNGGTCSAKEDGSYGCICSGGFDGANCQLLTVSFSNSFSTNSYRAYPSLEVRARGSIQFEFSTLNSNGLLLYNTQLQGGTTSDYIAIEILEGRLVASVSHGDDTARVSSAEIINDGHWHSVTIEIGGKSISITLDFCHDLDNAIGATAGCYLTAATQGQSSVLDLGLPLWLGGAPSSSPHVSSEGITACMRQVYINSALLDLNSHLHQSNSQPGCPQLDDQCVLGECGSGDCIATWSAAVCDCPPLLSGDLCDTKPPSLSYTGSGYAHYTLTEEGSRQSRQVEEGLRSTYEDTVSLSLRTTHSDGVLFSMHDKAGSDFLIIELESGQVVLHLNLGDGQETVLVGPGPQLNDSQRHSVTVARRGQHLNLSVDSTALQHSLPLGASLTLEIDSSEIYTGGSPYTTSWFVGCLQDVRLDHFILPTLDSNDFASVVYEGLQADSHSGITEGCTLSPCYLNPCGSGGVCEEMDSSSYQCLCSSGERTTTVCPRAREGFQYMVHVIGAGVLAVLLVVLAVTVVAGVCFWRQRKKKRTYLVGDTEKMNNQELAELFTPSQAVVISNEQGGGEEDTNHVDWAPLSLTRGPTSKPSPASSRSTTTKESPASRISHISNSSSSESSQKKRKYRFRLPVSEKETLEEEEEGEGDVRSNSPVIRAYLEERVNIANDEIMSVDSLRKFCDEGSEDSEVDSLSSAYSDLNNNDNEEEYTLERLRAAGPPLSALAPLLEHVLDSGGEASARDSSSDILLTSQTPQED